MVKAVFVLVALAITIGYIEAAQTKEESAEAMKIILKKCFDETGAAPAVLETFKKKEAPTTKEEKCFVGCFLKGVGVIRNGKYSAEGVMGIFAQKLPKDSPVFEKMSTMAHTCEKTLAGITDECELGAKALDCERPFLAGNPN